MNYRMLGHTGMRVSEVGLGTEYLIHHPREHVIHVINSAYTAGFNYFDVFFALLESISSDILADSMFRQICRR